MRILVTGASRGIGTEFVRQYAEAGHQVFAASRSAIAGGDAGVIPVRMDVTDPASIADAFEVVRHRTATLDLLINNAGIYSRAGGRETEDLGSLTLDEALILFMTNSIGPILIAQQFLGLLQKAEKPKLVSISSGYGSVACNNGRGPYHYGASKAALNHYMRSFSFDPKRKGIIGVVLSPGWVRTNMGGRTAVLTPEESVDGMIRFIEQLKPKDNGGFFDYRGTPLAW